jgi:hypothetical protein
LGQRDFNFSKISNSNHGRDLDDGPTTLKKEGEIDKWIGGERFLAIFLINRVKECKKNPTTDCTCTVNGMQIRVLFPTAARSEESFHGQTVQFYLIKLVV